MHLFTFSCSYCDYTCLFISKSISLYNRLKYPLTTNYHGATTKTKKKIIDHVDL